jgi:hypothetical protein
LHFIFLGYGGWDWFLSHLYPFPPWAYCEKWPFSLKSLLLQVQTAMKLWKILIKLGTNVDWTIAFVTTCSVLNFLLPWQRGDISKLPKITICLDFFHQNLFQSAATSQGIEIESKAFSVGYTLPYDRPGVILSLSQVQNFSWRWGGLRPLQTPQTPWCIF